MGSNGSYNCLPTEKCRGLCESEAPTKIGAVFDPSFAGGSGSFSFSDISSRAKGLAWGRLIVRREVVWLMVAGGSISQRCRCFVNNSFPSSSHFWHQSQNLENTAIFNFTVYVERFLDKNIGYCNLPMNLLTKLKTNCLLLVKIKKSCWKFLSWHF